MDDGVQTLHSFGAQTIHVIDLQDGILLYHAEQHQHSKRRVEVERIARGPQGKQGERDGEGEREQDGQRMDDALELRSEDHVHEDDGEQQRPDELPIGAGELAAAAGDGGGVGRRQVHLLYRLAQRFQPVRQRKARPHGRSQAHLALPVHAVDAGGRDLLFQGDEIAELVELAAAAGDEEGEDRSRIVAHAVGQSELDVVVVVDPGVVEAGNLIVAAHHQAQGVGDVGHVDSQVGGAVAVHYHSQLGPVELQGDVGVDDAAQLFGFLTKLVGVAGERLQVRTAQHEVDVPAAAADIEGGHVAHAAAQRGRPPQGRGEGGP